MRLTVIAALIVVLTAGGVSGQMDCPEITETALKDVIGNNIPTGYDPHQLSEWIHVPTYTVSDSVSCESEIRGKGR